MTSSKAGAASRGSEVPCFGAFARGRAHREPRLALTPSFVICVGHRVEFMVFLTWQQPLD